MPKVGRGKKAPKNPNVGQNKPAPKGKGGRGGKGGSVPAQVWDPGVANPAVAPFLTGEDIMAFAQARHEYESQLSDLDFQYQKSVADTTYQKGEITRGAVYGRRDASDELAARGLFRSSIRDGDLFDIDATAEIKKRFLDTSLDTLKLDTESKKAQLNSMWNDPVTGFMAGLELKKIANAAGVSADMPAWKVEPGWTTPSRPSVPGGTGARKRPTFQQNKPIGGKPNTGGTQAPSQPKQQRTGLKRAKKPGRIKGRLYG